VWRPCVGGGAKDEVAEREQWGPSHPSSHKKLRVCRGCPACFLFARPACMVLKETSDEAGVRVSLGGRNRGQGFS